jgi:LysM domain
VKPLRFEASDPQIDIEVPVGNLGAEIVGGLGGFVEVERQDDVSLTDWVGQEALRQDISVLLDGWANDESVERELNTLLKLARDPNGERVPPVFKVWGPLYYPGKSWVLPPDGIDMTGGEIPRIRRRGDGELLRQELIVHLLEYVPPEQVRLRNKHKPEGAIGQNVAVGGTYTTKKNDTLQGIAARQLNDWHRWKEIGDKNGIADPHRKLPAGLVLRMP